MAQSNNMSHKNSNKIGVKALVAGKDTIKVVLLGVTILMAVTLFASAWGGYVNPLSSTFFPVLTLALPIFFIVNLVIMIGWLVLLRWKYALISFAAILLSWGSIRLVFPINFISHADKATPENSIKILSFNVMNFGPYNPNDHNPSASMRYILEQNADVVLLQEGSQERDYMQLSNVKMMAEEIEKKYPYRSDANHDLVILSKYPYTAINDTTFRRNYEMNGTSASRYQCFARGYDLQMPNGKQLRLINLHLHSMGMANEDKELYMKITNSKIDSDEEFAKIKNSIYRKLGATFKLHSHEASMVRGFIDRSPENVILCGDFNDTPASYCYRTIRGNDMSDAFLDCGFGLKHTFHDNRMYFKIDHIMYRGDIEAVDWYRDKAGASDHYPQVATFVWK